MWSERTKHCLRGGDEYKDSVHEKNKATEEEKIQRFVKTLPKIRNDMGYHKSGAYPKGTIWNRHVDPQVTKQPRVSFGFQ